MIDTHMHYWELSREGYGWIKPDLGKIFRDFLPDDLSPVLRSEGIAGTIAVEATGTREETEFLLQLYEQHESILGVVGGLPLESETFITDFEQFRSNGMVGIRFRTGWKNGEWSSNPQVYSHLRIMECERFPIDLTFGFHEMASISKLLRAFPKLRVVLDPGGDPAVLQSVEAMEAWKKEMREITANYEVVCKVKPFGLMDLSRAENRINTSWSVEHLKAFVRVALELFGPSSLLFGSNWPVSLVCGEYAEIMRMMKDCLPDRISEEEKEAIFGLNAKAVYNLKT